MNNCWKKKCFSSLRNFNELGISGFFFFNAVLSYNAELILTLANANTSNIITF